jgi:cyclase
MLKVRIMPTLLYKNFGLVKGVSFDSQRRVGSVMQSIKVYNMRQVDELVFLDITATNENRTPDFQLIDEIADECFMPLTVGGGIKNIEDIRNLLKVGADKVAINSSAIINPDLVRLASNEFGAQCVVVSIDAKKRADGIYEVFTHSGTQATGKTPLQIAQNAESLGAGEILLTSIDRDGTMIGYDLELIKSVSQFLSIPVIASGGAGNYQHLFDALIQGKADAVAAASIFHFTHQTPLEAKRFLKAKGINVRL